MCVIQQKRVICATCGEFFKDEDKLSGHMMQKHKGFPGEQVSSNKAGQPMITCNTEVCIKSCNNYLSSAP